MPVERRLLDQHGRTLKVFNYDHAENKVTIQHHEDVEPVIEAVKEVRNGRGYSLFGSKELSLKASIPLTIINKWRIDDGVDVLRLGKSEFSKYLKRKVNDHYSKFRAKDKPL